MSRLRLTVAGVAAVASLVTATRAEAAPPDCSTLTTNPVYLVGASNSKALWAALAPHLTGVGIIFQGGKSCIDINEVTTAATDPLPAVYMDGSAAGVTCGNPGPAQLADSDVWAETCAEPLPSGFKDFHGPVQTMLFEVPYNSSETSISSDAAYTVYGWGGQQYPVGVWTNISQIFARPTTAGTEALIGSAIGLAPAKWLAQAGDAGAAQQISTPALMVSALQNAAAGANPSQAIGILASDLADSFRGPLGTSDAGAQVGGLKTLAFQAANQSCGYLPDSDATHYDKINVRQGRYDLWGPIHLITAVDASGNPTNANVASILTQITMNGLTGTAAQTIIQVDAKAHTIPDCAMEVSRSSEASPVAGGGMASYQPTGACGCYYETLVNGGQPYAKHCKTCTADTDCASTTGYPKCNFGFCEAK
jgi:hypothetical protein